MTRLRQFTDIQQELGLVPFVESRWGNLYCVPVAPGAPRLLVRLFDRELSRDLIPAHASMTAAAQAWIARDPELAALVRVDGPTEVGADFLARPHRAGDKLAHLLADEDPPEPPDELAPMQRRFQALAAAAVTPRERILVDVLRRSILVPTGKTFYVHAEEKFVIAELTPTQAELAQWAALS